jgi:hypothetical protein
MLTYKDFLEEPQIPGYEGYGPEPCLRQLIYLRYEQLFTADRARELTDLYINLLVASDQTEKKV